MLLITDAVSSFNVG